MNAHRASLLVVVVLALPSPASAQQTRAEFHAAVVESDPAGGADTYVKGAREIETEVIPSPRSTSPGGVVRLVYSVLSFEETDLRVRLRAVLPAGWTTLNPEFSEQEFIIEALDEIDGEILVTAGKDAKPGARVLVKIVAAVIGETGVYEGQNAVAITRSGGLKPGQTALTGTSAVGLSRVGASGMGDARTAGAATLSGKLGKDTTLSISAGRDMADSVTNYRYNFEPVRITGTLRRGGLEATVGNSLSSGGTALTGPFVRGRGGMVRKSTGRTIGDLTIVQPTTYAGDASGYLARGRVGLNRGFGSVAFVASDFTRPSGYTTLLPPVTVLDSDEAARQAIERRLAAGAARNRVFGAGVEAELRHGKEHRFTARTGTLSLSNAAGLHQTAPSFETGYGYAGRDLTLNLRWRDMPESMPGVQIGGDEAWMDSSVRLHSDVWLVTQAFRSLYEVSGQRHASANDGASLGTRYQRRAFRVEARANYRESTFDTATIRRSGSMYLGMPVGVFSVNAGAELGETEGPRGIQPLGYYNASLRWSANGSFASFTLSQVRNGTLPQGRRADVLGSFKVGLYELAGGAWLTQGYLSGGYPGVWSTVGVPVVLNLTAVAGLEYAPLDWNSRSDWRGSFTLRRPLTLPLGFLK